VTLVAPRWEMPLVPNPVPLASPASAPRNPDEWASRAGDDEVSHPKEDFATAEQTSAPEEASDVPATAPATSAALPKPWRSPISRATGMLLILLLWGAGMAFSLARLALGAARVRRVCRLASSDADGEWSGLLADLSEKLGVSRPIRLLFSEDLAVPVTTGVSRPIVLLPESARRWNDERRRVVLLHELAHVKRADWVALVIGQVAAAVYWFHPLAWSVRIQMRKDCERACDDLVLASGTRASVYAAHLLSIIRSLRLSRQRALPAVAMARRSYWDRRMRAILDPGVERRSVSPAHARLAGGMLLAVVVALAALEPWSARKAEAVALDRSSFYADADSTADAVVTLRTDAPCDGEAPAAKPAAEPEEAQEPVPAPESAEADVAVDAVAPEAPEPPEAPASGFVQASKKKHREGSWYAQGMELHNEERYDEAIAAFQHSIEEGERVEAATYNIACGYARKGDGARAFDWLQKAIEEGFDADSYLAKDDDLDSLRSDPRFAQLRRAARENKAEGSRAQADRIAARYERLKATPAARGKSFYEIGKELLEVGRYDLAAQAFEASAAHGYREGASLYNTACALSLKGDRARALDYVQKSIEAGFDDPRQIRKDEDLDNVRGEPRYRELLKMAEDLELHRFDDFAGHKKWLRSSRVAAWREVEQHFDEYTRRHPDSARAWFNLGYARIEGDRAAEAIPAFQRALDRNYRKSTTMYNLACAYSLMDRKDEAFGWLFKALDAGFDANGNLRGDEDLDNLRGDPRFRQALARVKNHDAAWND
jgi:beta-lactamase regulating signal transducer with metallopeptidase domain/tetratricopeptide (TPR) repeat protein